MIIIITVNLPVSILSQNHNFDIEKLQNVRAINLEKGLYFKHWVNNILLDDDQLLWISSGNLLYTYDGVTVTEKAHVEEYENLTFKRIFEINDTFFLFDYRYPAHYYPYKESGEVIKESGWEINPFSHCLTNKDINLISTGDGKVLKYIDGKFETLFSAPETDADKNFNGSCNAIIIDTNDTDKIWYYNKNNLYHIRISDGTYDAYNSNTSDKLDLNYTKPHGFYPIDIMLIDDNIYMGSVYNGLIRFNVKSKRWHSYSKPVPTDYIGKEDYINSVLSILPYNDSTLMLGGTINSFFDLKKKVVYEYTGNNRRYKLLKSVTTLKTDDAIFRNNYYGGVSIITPSANQFDNQNNSPIVDYNDTSSNGIRYKSDTYSIYGINNNNDTTEIIDIINVIGEEVTENLLVDKNDNIWIGSATGLILYSTTNGTYKKFKEMDGLATENWSKEFSIGYISDTKIKAKTSELFSVFDMEILLQESKVPKPYITKVEILDSTIFLSQDDPYELYLEPEEDYFTIHYSAMEYNNGRNLLFDYMIESYDKDWITGGLSHKVSYKHLPPGTYDFLVRAYTAEAKASVVSDKFVIKVRAHWYESLYFKLALLLLTGIILYLFYKMKTNSLRRELALRSQYSEELSQVKLEALRSQMNPHFLFNCLNSIDNFILSNDAQNASEYLGKFSKLIRNILDYSKTNLITLKEEIESTELYIKMEQMRFTDKFDYKISIDPSINQNLKSIPPLILQPYVENSIWHGLLHKKVKGTIRISISQDSNYYNIKIDDDGIGRQKAQSIKTKTATKRKSHGMKITEDRIRLVHQLNCQGGTVDIIDKVEINGSPMGTTVVIKLAIPEITSSR